MLFIHSCLHDAIELLNTCSNTARLDAELLLAKALQVTPSYLLAYPEQALSQQAQGDFMALLQRRLRGEPIAYILGHQEFWSLDLLVNSSVLIPRPETELLVELALKRLPGDQPCEVLDLGTGSGAIALALARECPKWQLLAMDNVDEALKLAQQNAKRFGIRNVVFKQSHWFSALRRGQQFHAIVSNPPYIANLDPHLRQGDIRFEPSNALIAGVDGLSAIRHIVCNAPFYLLPHGYLLLEHGDHQAAQVIDLMEKAGFAQISVHQDLSGLDRVITGVIK